jgi:hypothetical protein
MTSGYPYIFVDYSNSIWKFSINDNEELRYNIMYEEGKWTKEIVIDKDVLGFAVYIEEDETKHIVYSNMRGELKYCTMQNKQWVGKTLYHVESDESQINDINVIIILGEMHIFYMLTEDDGSDHAVLMHCRWNGREAIINTLQDIILVPNIHQHYELQCREKDTIDVFFITDEGDEASLQYCNFEKNRWSQPKRLYGIQGDSIRFEILSYNQEINILNRSKEKDTYLLDHVSIDMNWNIEEFRVYDSSKKQGEPILFIEESRLYCCWFEQGKILYSFFDGEKWAGAKYLNSNIKSIVQRYNYCIPYDEKSINRTSGIYGTVEPDLQLIVPYEFVKDMHHNELSSSVKAGELYDIKEELQRVKTEKKALERKIASFNMQLQKKQRVMEEYEDSITKILEQKRKVEENCNIYLEVQQNIQKELKKAKKQLSEEDSIKEELLKQIREKDEENKKIQLEFDKIKGTDELFQIQIKKLSEDNEILRIQGEKLKIDNELFKIELNKSTEEKDSLKIQIELIKEERVVLSEELKRKEEENLRLYEQLQFERNQSIMDRLLRRRSS